MTFFDLVAGAVGITVSLVTLVLVLWYGLVFAGVIMESSIILGILLVPVSFGVAVYLAIIAGAIPIKVQEYLSDVYNRRSRG